MGVKEDVWQYSERNIPIFLHNTSLLVCTVAQLCRYSEYNDAAFAGPAS